MDFHAPVMMSSQLVTVDVMIFGESKSVMIGFLKELGKNSDQSTAFESASVMAKAGFFGKRICTLISFDIYMYRYPLYHTGSPRVMHQLE
ncbi:hypothetical protein TNCV_3200481 [Trichonephila clavipes]|nr:hypothetical protein TNCV_3200481 [Trichonephila clavipes]